MIKSMAVLTSGGDSPGMNAAIRAVVRTGLKHNLKMYMVSFGFKGLVDGSIKMADRDSVKDIINRGGTIIGSTRLPEFKELAVQQKAIDNLRKHKIDSLVCIGGDGTYQGALALSRLGFPTVALPATIDNDVASTDYTIGFDTCLNTIIDCIDKLRDTTSSHQRCSLIEVMGRQCGDLAIFSGIAEGVELVMDYTHRPEEVDIIKILSELKRKKKRHAIMLVSENLVDVHELADHITQETGFETKAEVLGRLQRGGSPTAFDRVLASRLGSRAAEILIRGQSGRCIGMVNNQIRDYDIEESLTLKKPDRTALYQLLDTLK
ncbi:MAG: 6-phosphofructokinase [Erysipelotrichaceae bacterium]|jgi:6-phosphofructokinase 1|nr:6-phosphofructokinase [Erysipelotrichaceae bacterium]